MGIGEELEKVKSTRYFRGLRISILLGVESASKRLVQRFGELLSIPGFGKLSMVRRGLRYSMFVVVPVSVV